MLFGMENDYGSGDDENHYCDEDDVDYDENAFAFQPLETDSSSGPTIKLITKESLLSAQREDLQRIMDFLSLKEHHARALLIRYHWDVEKVLAVLVEHGKDELFAQAGVSVVEHNHVSFLSQFPSNLISCNICFNNVLLCEATSMDCGHCFCNSCWTEHFIVQINDGKSRRIRCMAHKCNAICDEAKIRYLVSAKDYNLSEKFYRFLLESYIEDNERVKWCPSVPHCGNAIQIDVSELCEVECACGLQFCFSCSSEAHSPCTCIMWELWSKKYKDESLAMTWITAHTRPCPNCCKPVEKNGGCNMVLCICGQSFNWISGVPCNHNNGKRSGNERPRSHDHRYIHYHKLYKAHTESLKLEVEMKGAIQDKVKILSHKFKSFEDLGWISDALNWLFRSRRILSFSYPFAFYMFDEELLRNDMTGEESEIKRNFFEDQQEHFEANIEKLSLYLEENFDSYNQDQVKDFRTRVVTQSVATNNLCRNLYEWIETDLLGSLKHTICKIALFNSKGVDKASKFLLNC